MSDVKLLHEVILMASTIKQRLRRYNGTDYDTIYLNANVGDATGTLAVANGGTGQTTLAAARNAMGLGNTTGVLPIANGGTGDQVMELGAHVGTFDDAYLKLYPLLEEFAANQLAKQA